MSYLVHDAARLGSSSQCQTIMRKIRGGIQFMVSM